MIFSDSLIECNWYIYSKDPIYSKCIFSRSFRKKNLMLLSLDCLYIFFSRYCVLTHRTVTISIIYTTCIAHNVGLFKDNLSRLFIIWKETVDHRNVCRFKAIWRSFLVNRPSLSISIKEIIILLNWMHVKLDTGHLINVCGFNTTFYIDFSINLWKWQMSFDVLSFIFWINFSLLLFLHWLV